MSEAKKLNAAFRILEEAVDRGARQGVTSEYLLQGMLAIFVASRMGLGGVSKTSLLMEVHAQIDKFEREAPHAEIEIGPPLGEGDN